NPLPEGFRLIDVHARSIVQPRKFVKYCALSYVWGSIEQPFLTKRNNLESPNALHSLNLPTTIIDAMALCRKIDCQYLWVDSLCIIQDSDNIKARQIQSMADVYSLSYLCIVAAAGDDANSGLSPYGVAGREKPISCLVRVTPFGRFVASISPQIAAEAIANSTWASRGW
ncbi:heterokaryon incompatibility, partial [Glonium stellatum]